MSLNPFKKKSYVGIDIGHKTINLVHLDRSGGGWKVSRSISVPTPPESVSESVVIDEEAVGAAIKTGLREGKIHAGTAITSVSGGSVIVRLVKDMAKMSEDMLRKSIKFEAGRYVPSSVEDSYIEFEILDQSQSETMSVMIVAAPRDVVESRIKAIEFAGLDVEAVDVESFATYRSLIEFDETSDLTSETIALVDLGSELTTVSIVSNGNFVMTRTIPQGSQAWTEALMEYFKLTEEDAESGKAQLDLTELTQDAVLENQPLRVLQPQVDDLVREIRRSLNYFQSQQTEDGDAQQATHLVLSGGGARIVGLAPYMAHKLGMDVRAMGVFQNPKFSASGADAPDGMDLTVAAGLAMRGGMKSA